MSFKKTIGFLHLWLGLASGLVVLIVALTGCLYAFQAEIQNLTQPYRYTEAQAAPLLPPSRLRALAEATLPGQHAHSVNYGKSGESATVIFYSREPELYYGVYLSPYTGKILAVKDLNANFFRFVLEGHFNLWLPRKVGQPIVAIGTLIFVVMLITGLILWWPKNKSARRQRLWFRWEKKPKRKRKNYDLHNILGFYMLWVALFLALTGLVWGFEWFSDLVYKTASGGKSMTQYAEPLSDTTKAGISGIDPMDRAWRLVLKSTPNAESIEVHTPENKHSPIIVNVNPDAGTYYKTDYRYFDQYTLRELSVDHPWGRYHRASGADKLLRMNYDIHVGAIGGLPGKCLAFFASLIAASLPVTGFLIWYGRRKRR